MIDNIKFEIPVTSFEVTKYLECREAHEVEGRLIWEKYRLYNKSRDQYLSIRYIPSKNVLEIKNSLRKWHFGTPKLLDFTILQFVECLRKLATLLNIEEKHLILNSTVCYFELGKNIKSTIPINEFIRITKTMSCFSRSDFPNSGVTFFGNYQRILLYDKLKEMKHAKSSRLDKNTADLFLKTGNYFIRYEIQIKPSHLNRMKYKGKKINSLEDLINNYSELLSLWKNNFNEIVFSGMEKTAAGYPFQEVSYAIEFNKFIYSLGLESIGIRNVMEALKATKINHSGKSGIRKKIRTICKEINPSGSLEPINKYKVKIEMAVAQEVSIWKVLQLFPSV